MGAPAHHVRAQPRRADTRGPSDRENPEFNVGLASDCSRDPVSSAVKRTRCADNLGPAARERRVSLPWVDERSQLDLIAICESVPDFRRRAKEDVSNLPMRRRPGLDASRMLIITDGVGGPIIEEVG